MFERFTSSARRAVVLAQEEARRLDHNYIGTEHVLLGLLGETDSSAAAILAGFGITRESARQEVADIAGRGKAATSGHIPFTPRAKKCLELSLREALALHHNYIGTEHVLLGLIREGEGLASQILRNHGDLLAIRAAVLDAIPPGTGDTGESAMREGAISAMGRWLRRQLGAEADVPGREAGTRIVGARSASATRVTPAGNAALSEAAKLAGPDPVGSQHLLLAALADPQSAAAQALTTLGVDLDQAREALRATDVTGTTDEQPEEAGRRQLSIHVTDHALTLVVTDPVIVAAGQAAAAAITASAQVPSEKDASAEATSTEADSGKADSGKADSAEAGTRAAAGMVFRGDHPAAASTAGLWLELRDCLRQIANSAMPPAAGAPGSSAELSRPRPPATTPDATEAERRIPRPFGWTVAVCPGVARIRY